MLSMTFSKKIICSYTNILQVGCTDGVQLEWAILEPVTFHIHHLSAPDACSSIATLGQVPTSGNMYFPGDK